ncbi:MAG TPA: hypothetical protein RMF84_11145, partial [Polyangiaceae bacterium LLY-WYZ-14_1]|nr:hypothetical protein [Polyangiaceae bacterium LLY-WYZ-14_1]
MPLTGELAVGEAGEVLLDQRVVRLTVDLRFDGLPPPSPLPPEAAYWVVVDRRGEVVISDGDVLAVTPGTLWLQLTRRPERNDPSPPFEWPVGRSVPVQLSAAAEPPDQVVLVDLPTRRQRARVAVDGAAPLGHGLEWRAETHPSELWAGGGDLPPD